MSASVEPDDRIARKVAAIDVDVGDGVVEHPADVGVEKPSESFLVVAMAVNDGTMVIAAVVGVGVMAAVVGGPGEQRVWNDLEPRCAQHIGDPRLGLKALVRE